MPSAQNHVRYATVVPIMGRSLWPVQSQMVALHRQGGDRKRYTVEANLLMHEPMHVEGTYLHLGAHQAGVALTLFGVGCLLYSLTAKAISFQGDFPLTKAERITHPPTTANRLRAAAISLLPLGYGVYLLFWR